MPRPKTPCRVRSVPPALLYTPYGAPLAELRGVTVSLEEYEALRLVDALGVNRREAALRMGISRPSLCRILARARNALARAISSGWAIRVDADAANGTADPPPCARASAPCGPGPANARAEGDPPA